MLNFATRGQTTLAQHPCEWHKDVTRMLQTFLHHATMLKLQALYKLPQFRPSVTRRYCVKTTARSTVQFALSDSKMCLVL